MEIINNFKINYLRHNAQVISFYDQWPKWKNLIIELIDKKKDAESIFNLGDYLSEIFLYINESGRSQSSLSKSGTAWECLVMWYLNLIFWNTNVVAVRQNINFIPEVIKNILTVNFGNNKTNSESDIILFSIPNYEKFFYSGLDNINYYLSNNLSKVDLLVLQCKTNWNDNAQIPMLWDAIYRTKEFRFPGIDIGTQGVSPSSLKSFSYSFVTVPSNIRTKFSQDSTSVLRVRNLSGGNYWGRFSKNNVAKSIKELPGHKFSESFTGGVISHINNNLNSDQRFLEKFLDFRW